MTSIGPSTATADDPTNGQHLPQVRKLIVSQFADEIAAAGVVTADLLYNRASALRDERDQRFLMEASALLRYGATELATHAAAALAKRFDQKLIREETGSHATLSTFSMSSLSLQDDDEVQENIAINDSARRVKDAASFEFLALTMRMQALTNRAILPDNDNPVFPKVFCRALLDALVLIDARGATKLAIFSGFQSALEKILPKIYGAINSMLIGAGVMPNIVETYGKPVLRDSWQAQSGGPPGGGNGIASVSKPGTAPSRSGRGAADVNDDGDAPGSISDSSQSRRFHTGFRSNPDGATPSINEPAHRGQSSVNREFSNDGGRYLARRMGRLSESRGPAANNEQAASNEIVGLLQQLIAQQQPATPASEAQVDEAGFAEMNAQLVADLGATQGQSASPIAPVSTSSADQSDRIFIGSIAFVDIVGFSKLSVSEQSALKDRFNALLTEASREISADQRLILDTGDGAALSFLGDPEDALFVCMKMRALVRQDNEQIKAGDHQLKLCQGINLGPVKMTRDINGQPNILGDGINVAQRIMSFAGPDQVAVSRSYFDVVSVIGDEYASLFTSAGIRADKHLREHEIYMLGESSKAYDLIRARVAKRYPNAVKAGAVTGPHATSSTFAINTVLLDALNHLQLSLKSQANGSPSAQGCVAQSQAEKTDFPTLLPDFTGSNGHMAAVVAQDPAEANVLHNVQALLSPQMTPAEAAAADLLASIFDRIFGDPEQSAAVKSLLGRLQIAALKVAIQNPEQFTEADNSLRLLIDRIATLGKEQGVALGENDAFYKMLARTVQSVHAENATEAGVLEGALIKLNTSVILQLWA